jgi:N6-adenosine-specific RNA methylase IME4
MRSPRGHARAPEAHYATMTTADIAALPVGMLASRDCLLFLWSTWPHLPQAMAVMAAWGFTYKTGGAWVKRTRRHWGPAFGTGYILRSATEPFLIGTMGAPEIADRAVRNLLLDAERREHSRKPPEARALIERLLPRAMACELFARERWPGRDVWGLEADRFDHDRGEACHA